MKFDSDVAEIRGNSNNENDFLSERIKLDVNEVRRGLIDQGGDASARKNVAILDARMWVP